MVIISQYPSICSSCRGLVETGDRIHWEKGEQGAHVKCPPNARQKLLEFVMGPTVALVAKAPEPTGLRKIADRLFRFVAGLNMQYRSITEQKEYLQLIRDARLELKPGVEATEGSDAA